MKKLLTILLILISISTIKSTNLCDTSKQTIIIKENVQDVFVGFLEQSVTSGDFSGIKQYFGESVGFYLCMGDEILTSFNHPPDIIENLNYLFKYLPTSKGQIYKAMIQGTDCRAVALYCTSRSDKSTIQIIFFFDEDKIIKVYVK